MHTRSCVNGEQGEEGCKGATAERAACNTQACPSWTMWSSYGACSVSCGGGTQMRGRQCDNGVAGQPGCDGMATQERYCNGQVCPHWSAWAEYGACSKRRRSGHQEQGVPERRRRNGWLRRRRHATGTMQLCCELKTNKFNLIFVQVRQFTKISYF